MPDYNIEDRIKQLYANDPYITSYEVHSKLRSDPAFMASPQSYKPAEDLQNEIQQVMVPLQGIHSVEKERLEDDPMVKYGRPAAHFTLGALASGVPGGVVGKAASLGLAGVNALLNKDKPVGAGDVFGAGFGVGARGLRAGGAAAQALPGFNLIQQQMLRHPITYGAAENVFGSLAEDEVRRRVDKTHVDPTLGTLKAGGLGILGGLTTGYGAAIGKAYPKSGTGLTKGAQTDLETAFPTAERLTGESGIRNAALQRLTRYEDTWDKYNQKLATWSQKRTGPPPKTPDRMDPDVMNDLDMVAKNPKRFVAGIVDSFFSRDASRTATAYNAGDNFARLGRVNQYIGGKHINYLRQEFVHNILDRFANPDFMGKLNPEELITGTESARDVLTRLFSDNGKTYDILANLGTGIRKLRTIKEPAVRAGGASTGEKISAWLSNNQVAYLLQPEKMIDSITRNQAFILGQSKAAHRYIDTLVKNPMVGGQYASAAFRELASLFMSLGATKVDLKEVENKDRVKAIFGGY